MIKNCPKRKKGENKYRKKQGNLLKHKAPSVDTEGNKNENSGGYVFVVGMTATEGSSCWIYDLGA